MVVGQKIISGNNWDLKSRGSEDSETVSNKNTSFGCAGTPCSCPTIMTFGTKSIMSNYDWIF